MENQNLIGMYDETKVTVREDEDNEGKIVWYDITEIVRNLLDKNVPSMMEYSQKIEMEICQLYDNIGSWKTDLHAYVKEAYEEAIHSEYGRLACFKDKGGLNLCNDARLIRVTFKNGATIEVSNSEWGMVTMGAGEGQ